MSECTNTWYWIGVVVLGNISTLVLVYYLEKHFLKVFKKTKKFIKKGKI